MAGAVATAGCGATAVAEEEVWEEAGVGVAGATWAGAGAAQGVVQGAAERNEAVESGVPACDALNLGEVSK